MKISAFSFVLLVLVTGLVAQPSPEAKAHSDALKLRGDMAGAVGKGSETSAAALVRLKKEKSPTGLKLDADADFAFAAIDVGRRLIATGKPSEAEAFFQAAEAALGLVISRTADSAARDKAQYLQIRATIRANYLNKLAEGKADLEVALALVPDDKRLRQLRNLMTADPATTLQNHKEPPSNGVLPK